MPTAIRSLLDLLDLETLGPNVYLGQNPAYGWRRVYGGQVVGQALAAAYRSLTDRTAHSLHGYFLRAGDPTTPIAYEVDRVRDGRSFATRHVAARQHGEVIFTMSASFQADEPGFEHQEEMPVGVPAPETLPSEEDYLNDLRKRELPDHIRVFWDRERPIEMRQVDFRDAFDPKAGEPSHMVWLRSAGTMPDDPALHHCVLAYATDYTLLDTALIPHGMSIFDKNLMVASLDHTVWLHRPFRMDEWLLYVQTSTNAGGARGFTRGSVFTRDGVLVASVAQEGLIRRRTR